MIPLNNVSPDSRERVVRRAISMYRSVFKNAPDLIEDVPPDLCSLITRLVSLNEKSNLIFRGEAEHYCKISSSLYRSMGSRSNTRATERVFDVLIKADQETVVDLKSESSLRGYSDSDIATLGYVQHYKRRSTNLLDFTESILVALYFACADEPHKDGRIIVVDRDRFPAVRGVDFCRRETQSIRPSLDGTNRNIHQWSHFLYPVDGYLHEEDIWEVITISSQFKRAVLQHLDKKCNIKKSTLLTDDESDEDEVVFECQGSNRHSRKMWHLGVTMEWIGQIDEARYIYRALGASSDPEATIRELELKLERGAYCVDDIRNLRRTLDSKANILYLQVEGRKWDSSNIVEFESRLMEARAAFRLSRNISSELPALGAFTESTESFVFQSFGKGKLDVGKKLKCNTHINWAIPALETALLIRSFEWDHSPDPIKADILYQLADAEMHIGMHAKAVERVLSGISIAIKYFPEDHPKVTRFEELERQIRHRAHIAC